MPRKLKDIDGSPAWVHKQYEQTDSIWSKIIANRKNKVKSRPSQQIRNEIYEGLARGLKDEPQPLVPSPQRESDHCAPPPRPKTEKHVPPPNMALPTLLRRPKKLGHTRSKSGDASLIFESDVSKLKLTPARSAPAPPPVDPKSENGLPPAGSPQLPPRRRSTIDPSQAALSRSNAAQARRDPVIGRCAYVSKVNGPCGNLALNWSQQCEAHTCTMIGCTSEKPSREKYCPFHSNTDPRRVSQINESGHARSQSHHDVLAAIDRSSLDDGLAPPPRPPRTIPSASDDPLPPVPRRRSKLAIRSVSDNHVQSLPEIVERCRRIDCKETSVTELDGWCTRCFALAEEQTAFISDDDVIQLLLSRCGYKSMAEVKSELSRQRLAQVPVEAKNHGYIDPVPDPDPSFYHGNNERLYGISSPPPERPPQIPTSPENSNFREPLAVENSVRYHVGGSEDAYAPFDPEPDPLQMMVDSEEGSMLPDAMILALAKSADIPGVTAWLTSEGILTQHDVVPAESIDSVCSFIVATTVLKLIWRGSIPSPESWANDMKIGFNAYTVCRRILQSAEPLKCDVTQVLEFVAPELGYPIDRASTVVFSESVVGLQVPEHMSSIEYQESLGQNGFREFGVAGLCSCLRTIFQLRSRIGADNPGVSAVIIRPPESYVLVQGPASSAILFRDSQRRTQFDFDDPSSLLEWVSVHPTYFVPMAEEVIGVDIKNQLWIYSAMARESALKQNSSSV